MIRHLATVVFALLAMNAAAQEFEHAQTRIQEGIHEFFVRPMVAELEMLNGANPKTYPSYPVYKGRSLNEITQEMLENAKANAAYKAAEADGADIILGATFYVTNNKKEGGLNVIVRGYPAKYVGFHRYGDKKDGTDDSLWLDPLLEGHRNRTLTPASSSAATKAVQNRTK